MLVDGGRQWLSWDELDMDTDGFPALGAALEQTAAVTVGPVGSATARRTRLSDAVTFGADWLRRAAPAKTAAGAQPSDSRSTG